MRYLRIFLVLAMLCSFAGLSFAAGQTAGTTINISANVQPVLQLSTAICMIPSYLTNNGTTEVHIGDAGTATVPSMSFGKLTFDPLTGYFAPPEYYAVQLFPVTCGRQYSITVSNSNLVLQPGPFDLGDLVTITPVLYTGDKYTDPNDNSKVYGTNPEPDSGDQIGVPVKKGVLDNQGFKTWTGQWMTVNYAQSQGVPLYKSSGVNVQDHIVQAWIGFFSADKNQKLNNNNAWPLGMTIRPNSSDNPYQENEDLSNYLVSSKTLAAHKVFLGGATTATIAGSITFSITLL